MSRSFTVLGAGIVGVCTALALQRDGYAVTLVDRDEPGRGCSFGNAGILHAGGVLPMGRPGILAKVPAMLLDPDAALVLRWRHLPRLMPWLARLVWASRPDAVSRSSAALAPLALGARAAYAPLLKEASADHLVRPRGEIYAYRSRAGFVNAEQEMAVRRQFGVPIEVLDAKGLREFEPAISPDYTCGHYQPGSAYVTSPLRLVQSLVELFIHKGGTLMRRDVRAVRPSALDTDQGVLPYENLVICMGAYSRELAAQLGADVPLESWRGYHIMVSADSVKLNGLLVDGDLHFAVTPMEDGIRVAGLIELASLHAPPNFDRADLFLKLARMLLPTFPTQAESRWMGHRPGTPDSLPVIGRAARHPNVYFNFGHGSLGLTFGAITAQLLADIVAARTSPIDPAPYRVERFRSPSSA